MPLWSEGQVWLLIPEVHVQNPDGSIEGGVALGAGKFLDEAGMDPVPVKGVEVAPRDLFHALFEPLVTFPGEPSVEVGLAIKKSAPRPLTFVAGYTNGYLYYAPTEKQRANPGCAQEDCDCLVAPQWQKLFEERVDDILKQL